nr:response regulator transcription factor [Ramlibacter paludis]
MLVEDNARMADEFRRMLESMERTEVVAVARTQQEALAWLRLHPDGWDLALVDLFLQQGHGFEVLRHCRKLRRDQRAVVVTNYTRDPVREHARQAGADAVFDKSFELDALVDYCVEFCRSLDARFRPPGGLAAVSHAAHQRHARPRTLR